MLVLTLLDLLANKTKKTVFTELILIKSGKTGFDSAASNSQTYRDNWATLHIEYWFPVFGLEILNIS